MVVGLLSEEELPSYLEILFVVPENILFLRIGEDASIYKCLILKHRHTQTHTHMEGKIVIPFSVNVVFVSS